MRLHSTSFRGRQLVSHLQARRLQQADQGHRRGPVQARRLKGEADARCRLAGFDLVEGARKKAKNTRRRPQEFPVATSIAKI